MIVLADIEADGLRPTKVHVVVVKPLGGKSLTFTSMKSFESWVRSNKITKWVFHNGLGYDVPVINRLVSPDLINPKTVIDTFVVSRLIDYGKFNTHSIEELGKYLGVHKGSFSGPWDLCTPDMIAYCEQDVEVLEAVFNHYKKQIYDTSWAKAMRVEHDTAILCEELSSNGFPFDKAKAEELLVEVKEDMGRLHDAFSKDFPPTLEEKTRIQVRRKKDGELFKNVEEAMSSYPSTFEDDDGMLVCLDYQEFNPGSSKQRIDKLWEAGWKPVDKTDGYRKFLREKNSWKR